VGVATGTDVFGVAATDPVDVDPEEDAASVVGCPLQAASTTSGIRAVQF